MRLRILIVLLGIVSMPCVSFAREAFHGWCELGNQSVVTQGLSSTTKAQQSNPQCVVTVFVHGGGLATIYSDNNNTPLANPFQAQLNGLVIFYANDGRYDIQFSPGTTYLDWLLCDPFTPGAVCSGASSGAHNLLSTTHLDTIPFSPPVRGDLITAQNLTSPTSVNPAWARLPLGTAGQVLLSNGLDALWGTLTAGTGITITNTGSPPGSTVTISTSGGGGGCTLPGNDTGILTEHPIGTCYNSIDATWNDAVSSGTVNGQILLIGDGTNVVTAPSGGKSVKEAFVFGDHNTLTGKGASQLGMFVFGSSSTINNCSECAAIGDVNSLGTASGLALSEEYAIGPNNTLIGSFVYALGDFNTAEGGGMVVAGEGNSLNANGAGGESGINQAIILEEAATITLGGGSASVVDTQVLGSNDTFTVGNPSGVNTNQLNCLHGVGSANAFTITGGLGSSHSMQNISWVGKSNQFTANGFSMSGIVVAGNSNTLNATSVNITNGGIYGKSTTLANCSDCYIVGENVSLSTNNTLALGMSASDIGLVITNSGGTHDNVRRTPMPFTSLPSCAAGTEGSFAAITTSNSATNGVIITGGGTNHVLGYCDGTNWKVVVGT